MVRTGLVVSCLVLAVLIFSCKSDERHLAGTILNKDSLSIDSITQLIRKSPSNAALFAERSTHQINLNNVDGAIGDMEIAIKLDSLNPNYYIGIADYFLRTGKSGKAKEKLEKCIKLVPNNSEALIKLAQIHFFVKQYTEAMSYLGQAQEADIQNPQVYFVKSLVYKEAGDTSRAIENLQICVEKKPDYFEAYMLLGVLYAARQDTIAISYYNNALKINPQSVEGHYDLGLLYQETHRLNRALDEYQTIITKIDSNFAHAYYNIGYIDMQYNKEYRKAIPMFTKAIEKKSNYFEAYHNRGYCHEQLKEYDEAKNDYQAAIQIFPNYDLSVKGLNRIDKYIK